jgi:hypothetical protein
MKTNRRRPTPTFRPFLEALEDRNLPGSASALSSLVGPPPY